jgi:hypothetical protein
MGRKHARRPGTSITRLRGLIGATAPLPLFGPWVGAQKPVIVDEITGRDARGAFGTLEFGLAVPDHRPPGTANIAAFDPGAVPVRSPPRARPIGRASGCL